MDVIAGIGSRILNPKPIEPDEFIIMKELDSPALKVNHLSLYLKSTICALLPDQDVKKIDYAIDQIDLYIFVNGICEGNNSVRTLLAKNVVYHLAKENIIIEFSKIYPILGISKNKEAQTV